MKILCSGGGTLGPVTPLLGFLDAVRSAHPDISVVWVGTYYGVERNVVPRGYEWYGLPEAKFRRYLSLSTFGDLWRFVFACLSAFIILLRERPSVCVSAGGYVSVPVHLAAFILRIPTWVHQLDYRVGLANSVMSRLASCVTTSLPEHIGRLPKKTIYGFGTWVRKDILLGDISKGNTLFGASNDDFCVLVLGGGTGAQAINAAVCAALPALSGLSLRMIHLTGAGRGGDECVLKGFSYPWYKPSVFLGSDLRHSLARADMVIGRAGFATIAEAAALAKPLILIPKAGHQEDNVSYLESRRGILSIKETLLTDGALLRAIEKMRGDSGFRFDIGQNLHKIVPKAEDDKTIDLLFDCIGKKRFVSG